MSPFLPSLCVEASPIPVWNSSAADFGICFTKIAFIVPCHVLLGCVSAYFVGALAGISLDSSRRDPSRCLLVRLLCCLVLFLFSLFLFSLPAFFDSESASSFPAPVDVAVLVVVASSWLIHGAALFRRRHRANVVRIKVAADVVMGVAYLTILFPQALQARRAVAYLISLSDDPPSRPKLAESIVHVFICVTHLVYATSLIGTFIARRIAQLRHTSDLTDLNPLINEDLSISIVDRRPASGVQPEDDAGIFSRTFFCWVYPLLRDGANGHISENTDLYPLPTSISVSRLSRDLRERLSPGSVGAKDDATPEPIVRISLFGALVRQFGTLYFSVGLLKLFVDLLAFSGPLLLHALIDFMGDKSAPESRGYGYAVAFLTTTATGALVGAQFQLVVGKIRLRIRAALVTLVYDRALGWSTASLVTSGLSTGEIVNAMSTDVDRIVNFCDSFHAAWSMPLQISIALYLLYEQIYLAFLAGLAFALLLIPVNKVLCDKILAFSAAMMACKDERIKLMSEILDGVRAIKFSGLEFAFDARIRRHREAELRNLKGIKYLDAACVFFWASTPVMITLLSFLTYCFIYSSSTLTAAKIFTSLALFNMLIGPLNAMPWVINGLVDAWVSLKRVQRLMDLQFCRDWSDDSMMTTTNESGPLVVMTDTDFSWSLMDDNGFRLRGLTLTVSSKTLVGVVGRVGSGKSSLLHALIGEMNQEGGEIHRNWNADDGIAFLPQQAWIPRGTVEENVLFGRPMDRTWYRIVLDACCLTEDVASFPQRDKTNVGQKGMSLSGGQKQRLALARAIYAKKSFYVLDCPFSALDRKVREEIWKNVFLKLLKDAATVVVASHYGAELFATRESGDIADWVVVLKDGAIERQGRPSEVLDLVIKERRKTDESAEEDCAGKSLQVSGWATEVEAAERRETGVVGGRVYRSYWLAIGQAISISILISLFLMQSSKNVSDWWLSYWAERYSNDSGHSGGNATRWTEDSFPSLTLGSSGWISHSSLDTLSLNSPSYGVSLLLMVYGIIGAFNLIVTLVRAFLFAYGGVVAARTLHDRLARSLFSAPLTFFESTPAGRVLNRFSSDLYSIDASLPFILNIFLAQAFGLAGVVVVVCCSLPLFLTLIVPIGAVYLRVQNFYRHTSREVKRLASVTLSPIYAHFTSSLEGAAIIRAMGERSRFVGENLDFVRENLKAQYSQLIVALWLNFNLQAIGVVVVFGASLAAILEHHYFATSLASPAVIGLAISYVLSVQERLSGVVSSFTETEKEMISVERVVDYVENIPTEQISPTSSSSPITCSTFDPSWPTSGTVVFEDVSLAYPTGNRLALNRVSFAALAGETVGISGRTGSGKSSLLAAMLRTHPMVGGRILVDGVDVRDIPLNVLRRRIAVVPQDPLLFTGSIRENLIPETMATDDDDDDEALQDILARCQLRDVVTSLGGLDAPLCPSSFSAGQKQLLGLARALRRQPKILCVDEATASVDLGTDRLLQKLIRRERGGGTLLCISHRVDDIGDFDKTLVMKEGRVERFGKTCSPKQVAEFSF